MSTVKELAVIGALFGSGLIAGAMGQHYSDSKITHAAEERIGTMYQTPRGGNWVLAHIYMPECPKGQKRVLRVVDTPGRDESDYLAVYCYDEEQFTKDELEAMAGNQ
jgi:hypothetical protein